MTRINPGRTAMLSAALAALALTAGCSTAPEPPAENNMTNLVETFNAMEANTISNEAAPVANVTASPANPGADFTTDAQTLDDAAATGMTAKLPEDNGTEPANQ